MNTLKKCFKKAQKWAATQGPSLYRYHREACVANLEGGSVVHSRAYYFGFCFGVNLFFMLVTLTAIIATIKQCAWIEDPWLGTVMFANFFPVPLRLVEMITRLHYIIEVVLVFYSELIITDRVPAYMKIFTTEACDGLKDLKSIKKFRQCQQLYDKINSFGSHFFWVTIVIAITFASYLESVYQVNPMFCLFWIIFIFAETGSSPYIFFAMPCNLVISVYYLNLKQKYLKSKIYKIFKIKKPARLMGRYEQCLDDYLSINRLISDYNHYWSFYLWMSITICPAIICQAVYVFLNEDIQVTVVSFMIASSFLNQLVFVVYHSTKVSNHNRLNSKLLANVYRGRLERNLVGDFRRHLHQANSMEHARLSKYSMTTIHGHHIGHRTYLQILLKFVYIFFKFIKNNHIRLK